MDTQSQIVQAVQNRLIDKIPRCSESTCWLEDQPLPKDPPPHQQSFVICVDDGRFDPDWGGNLCDLREMTGFTITSMVRYEMDTPKKLTNTIALAKESMLTIKRNILTALLVDTTLTDESESEWARHPWRPKNDNGTFMWDTLHPNLYIAPKRHQNWPLLYQYIEFNYSFFWDL